MKCENCNNEHDGQYGSGRFCSSKCARGFSTKDKRGEINKRVSESLKGKNVVPDENRVRHCFTEEERLRGIESFVQKRKEKSKDLLYEGALTKHNTIRWILMEEQDNKCAICGNPPIWNDLPITFDVDHIDGDSSNNNRENLRAICPNCHRQTTTFGGKNMRKGNSRLYLIKYLSYEERKRILTEKRISELEGV